ncbi:hypothetical protein CPAR01_11565 [Colletotrichum paranaense]|uniref:Uncharacterized protein n=7 Tax=Colletotrichum acutatum species complex TaxID=2707335 RepID=A0A010SM29_9PEZI|nr:uncharacterized protein CCOS01_10250 [Colletotrichum costaricense]XP_060346172.1 uncharacterized protein CPAR01_11565 [Colletotrichum paranaense]XP_060376176.1 uncharacterized protein CTAM01_13231 [Colletotrichum tamarilloi]XP_060393622.1 uncharacterized protein CABS01_14165 [Colletotrichum abscissum]EXF85918.1 hypothetical protein CFIO01_05966 [Colletotrichum fioriniae PJ7]KAI3541657.1 hypothetical protein CSPX01_07465 [Colletotrichum filicis]KAK0367637.1 hypothetical protein CLIM01_15006
MQFLTVVSLLLVAVTQVAAAPPPALEGRDYALCCYLTCKDDPACK